MAKFNIGSHVFTSKGAAKKTFTDMLKNYRVGSVAKGLDHDLLLALVNDHPWRSNMLRGGVKHFEVFSHKLYKRQTFWKIVRPDGSTASIAIARFFGTRNDDKAARFRERARMAIKPQLDRFRWDCFLDRDTIACALTGKEIGVRDTHVDHVVPFEDMILEWESIMGEDYSATSLRRFVEWHGKTAMLRCVDAKANLSRGRGRDDDQSNTSE